MIVRAIKYSAAVLGAALLAAPAYADHVTGHDEVARGGIKALEERVFDLEQAILALPPGGPPPGPTVFNVDCDAAETIQAALDQARDGDTINVTGTCFETDLRITLDNLRLDGGGIATIDSTAVLTGNVLQVRGASNVRIQGFTILGGGTGIRISRSGSGRIRDNIVEGAARGGITLNGSNDATIERNIIRNNGTNGVGVSRASMVMSSPGMGSAE